MQDDSNEDGKKDGKKPEPKKSGPLSGAFIANVALNGALVAYTYKKAGPGAALGVAIAAGLQTALVSLSLKSEEDAKKEDDKKNGKGPNPPSP